MVARAHLSAGPRRGQRQPCASKRLAALLLASLAGCRAEPPGPGAAAASVLASALASAAPAPSAPAPSASLAPRPEASARVEMPAPRRARGLAALRRNRECEGCHEREAAAWRGSMHQQAAVHPAYAEAFRAEPSSFCQGCHAPEAAPDAPVPAELGPLGVGCVTCHLAGDDAVLAAPSAHDSAAPHALRRSAEFAGDGACQGCHEFAFPGALDNNDASYMQTTIREHQRSAGASRPCSGCHMPPQKGGKSHDFAQTRSPSWLRGNLTVSATRDDDGVQIQLWQPAPGHGFPTGDLFRRLEVGVQHLAPDGRVLGEQRHHLARHFETAGMTIGRRLTRDDRVFDAPRQVVFSLPPGGKVRWWVSYQRVSFVGDGRDPSKSKLESQTPLHQGTLQ